MIEFQGTAASRGHVRTVFSNRCRGFVAPLALVEAHLRAVVRSVFAARRVANEAAIDAACDDLRGRIRAEFAGYLVSEPEMEPAFTERREHWRKWAEMLCFGMVQSRLINVRLRPGFPDDSLDAPCYLASGSGRWIESDIYGAGFSSQRLHVRGGLS